MGLKLRYNLFFGVEADEVYAVLESFWTERACQFMTTALRPPPEARDQYELHESQRGWTLLGWDGGWEWELRREAQLYVSRVLGCAGLLVFVYDGDYWGYELFTDGREVDHFVQDPEAAGWFPGRSCSGQPELFTAQFPAARLRPADIAPYLLPRPEDWDIDVEWDAPARTGDQFTRGDECAVLDFLRMLGVGVELRDHGNKRRYVTLSAPQWRAFKVAASDQL